MSKKSQKPQEPVYTYEENGVTIAVYEAQDARPGERTWQGTRGYTWNDDRKYVPPCGQRQAPTRDFFRL